ncbi:MAG: LrgB family protein [Paraprevotella sp.]|nr:LrgB family protein [Paraprevotella sp.]
MEYLENRFFLIALTFCIYWGTGLVQRRTGLVVLNPILATILILIAFLKITGIDYETYAETGALIDFWLKPAIVALGVPLYLQLKNIRQQWIPILVSQLTGCLVGIVSVVLTAKWLGASNAVIISLAPKSVTTPIAMEVTTSLNGIPSLTAAIVVCVGLFGAVCGFKVLQVGRVKSPIAQSLSMGTASHAVGTSRAMEYGRTYGAYASLGLILNGLLTALFTPSLLRWLNFL